MIIYDPHGYHGWSVLFHTAGSALFCGRTLVPAIISALFAALISNYAPIQEWLEPRMLNGSVVFSGIQFLVSLIVVNRVRDGSMRFIATHEAYSRFNFSLQRLAMFFSSTVDTSSNSDKFPEELALLRIRFLRWIRAIHVLAMEEFRGIETPQYRMGTLLFTEEILLFRESRRAARVIRWLSKGYGKYRTLLATSISTDLKMQNLIDEVGQTYGAVAVVSDEVYPFPLAQAALGCVIAYGFWSPLAFGVILPNSQFLAPLLCFASVWISYGCNLAAQMLEWPFDGKPNDLPLKYYSIRFVKEISEIEFGVDAPLVCVPFERLMRDAKPAPDYVVPLRDRPGVLLTGRTNTQDWLDRAAKDLAAGATSRKRLRHRLRSTTSTASSYRPREYDTGQSLSELRASGKFKILL